MKEYGLSWEEYERMRFEQDDRCAICGNKETSLSRRSTGEIRPLSIDHNHRTGRIRGLLCRACNHLIGNADEDQEILLRAINYLNKYKGEDGKNEYN
jgi:hypothetical protein